MQMKRKMLLGLVLFFGLFLAFTTTVHAQTGFISIDCGMGEDSTYQDDQTLITYSSDSQFIDTGINRNISSNGMDNFVRPQYQTLRSFPNGSRNCYTLRPASAKGKKFLIRANFLYGNYDGANLLPAFDLYVGTDLWWSLKLNNGSVNSFVEIITVATADFVSVCLVNTGNGTPFISTLELRPFDDTMYTYVNESTALVLFTRHDAGSTQAVRYPDDFYDRMWESWTLDTPWVTSSDVDNTGNSFKPPSLVMKTATLPTKGRDFVGFQWTDDTDSEFHVFLHFSELDPKSNGSRVFNITSTGGMFYPPFTPRYLLADTLYSVSPLKGRLNYTVTMNQMNNSILPPMLNAFEIYYVRQLSQVATDNQDVDSMMSLKKKYGVKRNWMGDPCLPRNFSWVGLKCNYNGSNPPRIISIDLSSAGLSGEIAADLANLTSIESLDLSNNNLTGRVPDFLADLPMLKFLNLSENQLDGTVPEILLARSKNGSLSLSVDQNPNLCLSESCTKKQKKRTNILLPILVPSVLAAVILLLMVMIIMWRRRSAARPTAYANQAYSSNNQKREKSRQLSLENRRFTYNEIVSMTNNFERVLGKGGFGTVYDGRMTDGTRVAIKLLSQSSSQGFKEFKTEAELLLRVHHKNLVSFIGYCDEGKEKALIYEYMAEGNLRQHLSGTDSMARALNWDQRLQIALDVAQGLEYLHNGCKPPIIHRDVKSANILLNEKLDAKMADFGLCKFFHEEELSHIYTTVKGTLGYLDPEYYVSEKLNEKSDVYSFGIVLLELITGHPAIIKISNSEKTSIVQWATSFLEIGDIRNLADPRLQGDYDINSVWKALEIAMACTPPVSIQRPNMSNVVSELKECLGKVTEPERTLSMRNELSERSFSNSFDPLPR